MSSNSHSNKAIVTPFYEKETNTAAYLIACQDTKKCAILDPILDFSIFSASTSTNSSDQIVEHIKKNGLTVDWILETHAHADHLSASPYLKSNFPNAKIGIGEQITQVQQSFAKIYNWKDLKTDGSQFDILFKNKQIFHIGNLEVQVLHTPGHTPACISYYIKDDCVFVGDTLFMPDSGTARCDFPLASAEQLWDSIHQIFSLPPSTRLFVCHDYQTGGRTPSWETSVAEQRSKNIHIKDGTTKEEFLEFRKKRDATLSVPKFIIPSVQVNINAGYFPSPESDGKIFLKIPINVFAKSESPGVFSLPK